MSTKLDRAVRLLFYTLILVTPWIWFRYTSELFEFPKMVFVYAITALITGLWLARMSLDKRWLIPKTPLDAPILAFLFVQIISTILSIHPRTSLLGYYSRFHGGLLSTISYLILYYAFIAHFNKRQTKTALSVLLGSSAVAALYAFPEHFGIAFSCLSVSGNITATCWVQDVQTRIFGTFGQPNWLAAFIVTVLPLTWALIARPQNKRRLWVYTQLLALQSLLFATLLFTKSRSGLLAAATGFVIFWLLSTLKLKSRILRPLLATGTTLAIVLLMFGSEYSPSLSQLISRTGNQPTAPATTGTVLDQGDVSIPLINQGGTESGEIRRIVWQGALDAALANPLFGTGLETFAYSYYNYRPVEHNLVSEWDFIYNKAHNEFLNFAATTGFIGLATYLTLIGAFLVLIYQASQNSKSATTNLILHGLAAGYLSLAVSNFFGFSTVSVGLLFFLYPAFSIGLSNPKNFKPTTNHLSNLNFMGKSQLGAVLLLTSFAVFSVGRYFMADIYYAKASASDSDQDLSSALQEFQIATSLSSEPKFHNDFADSLSKAALAAGLANQPELATPLAQQAFTHSAITLDGNPRHINFYKSQAGVFIRLSTLDPSLLEVADTILSEGSELAPTDAKLTYNLGLIKLDQEATDSAITYFQKAIDQKGNYEDARQQLAAVYLQQGDTQAAKEQYQYILNFINPGNQQALDALESLDNPDQL